MLSTVLGVACVAAMVGVAANVAIGLWTRSTVDAVAYDAARDIATSPAGVDRSTAAHDIVGSAKASLGAYGAHVALDVEAVSDDVVVLHLRADGVDLLPAMIDGGPTVGAIDRRIVVRVEAP